MRSAINNPNRDLADSAAAVFLKKHFNLNTRGGTDIQTDTPMTPWDSVFKTAAMIVPSWTGYCLKSCLTAAVVLYILNQKHLLPKPLSAIVSKTLFWPSLPLTVAKRLGSWSTRVDDTVFLGGVPLGFVNYPERLYKDYGVSVAVHLA